MFLTTIQRRLTMYCSHKRPGKYARHRDVSRLLPGMISALLISLVSAFTAADIPPIFQPPSDTVLIHAPPAISGTRSTTPSTEPELARQISLLLDENRRSGNSRPLGEAAAIFTAAGNQHYSLATRLLRADLYQRLHQFKAARVDLDAIVKKEPGNTRALLLLANLNLMQGYYRSAKKQCRQLSARGLSLIGNACMATVIGRTGKPQQAYTQLVNVYRGSYRASDRASRHWAALVLADLAEQLGSNEALNWWKKALLLAPEDTYTRLGISEYALRNQDYHRAIRYIDGMETDGALVIRAIAFDRLNDSNATAIIKRLQDNYVELRWRGEILHAHEYAWFLFALCDDASSALTLALHQWREQKDPRDTALLLQIAREEKRNDIVNSVNNWLASWQQQDARFHNQTQ